MSPKPVNELQDLIDRPSEREGLELKSWVDLTDKTFPARATIARHIAAISNYGGGYLVFGFNDDGTQCAARSDVRKLYGHDAIAGIVDRYLQPKFQCEVYFESRSGVEHAIVWIPRHGTVPVISKADGPKDSNGQPQGIRAGLIYVRSPKPESVSITAPEQWRELIQRCVLARRDELVTMFSEIVTSGSTPTAAQQRERKHTILAEFHNATQQAFLHELARLAPKTKFSVTKNFLQLSYVIHRPGDQCIPANEMLRVIEKVNTAVRDTVWYGWSMFHPFTRSEIIPRFMTDPNLENGETEFVQASLIEAGATDHLDLWRIAPDGRASLIRPFHEDHFSKRPNDISEDQRWFDPWLHVRDITELVRHARALSEEFPDVKEMCFQVEWKGLKGRTTSTTDWRRYWRSNTCQVDSRSISQCFSQAEVIGNIAGIVSTLYAPVHRLFDPRYSVTPEFVSSMMKEFRVQGL